MKTINIKGDIISDNERWIYEWYHLNGVSPSNVIEQLPRTNEPIKVIINSGGGSVFGGYEIYNTLKTYPGTVTVEIHGLAGSIASVIAMAGNIIKMSPISQIMIHNVSCNAKGDYREMDSTSEILKKNNRTVAKAYALKSGKDEELFLKLMNEETWFTSDEALKLGLVDEVMFDDPNKEVKNYDEKNKAMAKLQLLNMKVKRW